MLLHIFRDTHGPLEINKINPKRFLGRALTDNDAIAICGDFGFPFLPTDCISEDTLKDSGAEHYCIKYARAISFSSMETTITTNSGQNSPLNHGTAVKFRDCRTHPMSSISCAANTIPSMVLPYGAWAAQSPSIRQLARKVFLGGRRKSRLRKRCGTGWIRWKNTGMMSISS